MDAYNFNTDKRTTHLTGLFEWVYLCNGSIFGSFLRDRTEGCKWIQIDIWFCDDKCQNKFLETLACFFTIGKFDGYLRLAPRVDNVFGNDIYVKIHVCPAIENLDIDFDINRLTLNSTGLSVIKKGIFPASSVFDIQDQIKQKKFKIILNVTNHTSNLIDLMKLDLSVCLLLNRGWHCLNMSDCMTERISNNHSGFCDICSRSLDKFALCVPITNGTYDPDKCAHFECNRSWFAQFSDNTE